MRKSPPCQSTCIDGQLVLNWIPLVVCERRVVETSITMLALLVLQLLVIPTLTLCAQHGSNLDGSISGLSFLAIQNNEDSGGVEIIIVSNNAKDLSEQQQSQIHIPGHSLSSGCGDHYFRCQGDNLLVETLFLEDGREFEVIFIPLDDGLLLLNHWCDSTSQRVANNCSWNTTFSNSLSNCRPTVVYNISGKVYTVCMSSINQYFSMYEVRLHLSGTAIVNATLLGPLTEINSLTTSDLSNFVLVGHMVYFALGNTIVVMDILDSTRTHKYPELPECAQIHKLISITGSGNQQLLVAYCTDGYIIFDPVFGDWTGIQHFPRNEVPYLCPDNSYRVTHFINDTVHFSVRGVLISTINNVNISSGICFSSQSITYFAYSDREHNSIFVYNFITQTHYGNPTFPYDCSNTMECPQLLLLGNRYMIVRDANNIVVLDTTSNFSLVLNKTSGWATQTLLTVSHMSANDVSTVAPPSSDSTVVPTADIQTDIPEDNVPSTGFPNEVTTNAAPITTTDLTIPITEQSKSTDLQLPLIIVGSIAALVIIINIIAITIYFFKHYRKHHR